MSGTSLDGIDVAVVDIARGKFRLVAKDTTPYSADVRQRILNVSDAQAHVGKIARLSFELAELYAAAVHDLCRKHEVPLKTIGLIGCHGQTVFHEGGVCTLQLGEGAVLAERTGIPVVSDFRPADIAAGGQGAPLVPYVDYLLFRHARRGRVALNLGGIANITAIPPGGEPEDVVAFDTGPANMLIDALVAEYTRGEKTFDVDGELAARGHLNQRLLDHLASDPYYTQPPPKSAGREQYGRQLIGRLLMTGVPLLDLIATATALTATTVAIAIDLFVRPRMRIHELIVSGGGAHNPQIMAYLAGFVRDVAVVTSQDFGVDVDAKEAIAFAVLAHETWHGRPGNLPSATGAKRPVVLGKIAGPASGRRH
jgi:anhydro-N-acetylmuramic acid kinase